MIRPTYAGESRSWAKGGKIRCDCGRLAAYKAEHPQGEISQEMYLCNWHLKKAILVSLPIRKVVPMPEYRKYQAQIKKWIEKQSPASTPTTLF